MLEQSENLTETELEQEAQEIASNGKQKRFRTRNGKDILKLRLLVMEEMNNEQLTEGQLLVLNGAKDVLDWLIHLPETTTNHWLHNLLDEGNAGWYSPVENETSNTEYENLDPVVIDENEHQDFGDLG